MSTDPYEVRRYIADAREALRRGDKVYARQLAKKAALIAPQMEDAWLILTASAPDPQAGLAYAQRALKINPNSERARRALTWAQARLNQSREGNTSTPVHPETDSTRGKKIESTLDKHSFPKTDPVSAYKSRLRRRLFLALVSVMGCLLLGMASFFIWTHPAFAAIRTGIYPSVVRQENLGAPAEIAKPTVTPLTVTIFASEGDGTRSEAMATKEVTPTKVPTSAPTLLPSATPEASPTPGTIVMEIVDEASTVKFDPVDEVQVEYPAQGNGARWIDVNLSEQRVYAYEGDVVVNSFLVSTGLPETPTVTGEYKIWVKVRIQDMSGPGYYLKDVPFVMYFYEDYGFHGTYWHNNFGTPMSRGCVNLRIADAEWLYNWASVGTEVNIHY